MRIVFSLALAALAFDAIPSLAQAPLDTAKIEQAIGMKGTMIAAENVFKVSKARNDVKVEVDGWAMPPFMGLGSWAAFTPSSHGGAMAMGDTVVFEDEVNPAMSAGGLRHCHGKRLSAGSAPVVEAFHAAAVAACHCSIAFALRRRSVRGEMR